MARCADSLPPLAVIRMHHRVFSMFGCAVHSIKLFSRSVRIAQDVSRFHSFAVP